MLDYVLFKRINLIVEDKQKGKCIGHLNIHGKNIKQGLQAFIIFLLLTLNWPESHLSQFVLFHCPCIFMERT
jgi:hypothetical protein